MVYLGHTERNPHQMLQKYIYLQGTLDDEARTTDCVHVSLADGESLKCMRSLIRQGPRGAVSVGNRCH